MTSEALAAAGTKSWLYDPIFPEHWKRRSLYSLAQWVNGLAFRDIQFSSSGKPVIKIAEIKGGVSGQTKFTEQVFEESVHVRAGDLLFSWSGQPETSIDVFWWRGPDGWLNQHSFRVTPIEGVDPTFFFYLLRYLRPNFVGIARNKQTTGLGHVTKRDLENIAAAYPPLSEQCAIAHILGTLDDKIELNRRMNETLEAMSRALFKSWIVNFDPIRAKVANLIRDGVLEIGDGYRAKNSELGTHGLPFIRAGNLNNGFDTAGAELLREESVAKAGSKVCRVGDVAFTSKGTIGRFARVSQHTAQFVYSPQVCFWRSLDQSRLHPVILYSWMQSDDLGEQIAAVAGQTDMAPYVSLQDQRQMSMPVFPQSQHALARRIEPLLARQASNTTETRTLAALRDTLLPKLLSGEIRVNSGERIAEGVA